VARRRQDSFTSDTGVNTAYLRNLVVIKNSRTPVTASSRGHEPRIVRLQGVVRDSSFDAMALDASGHYSEARSIGNGWRPIKSQAAIAYDLRPMVRKLCLVRRTGVRQRREFLVGVYRHYQDTGDNTFLTTVWPAVQAAANFLESNVGTNGLVPRTTAFGTDRSVQHV